MCVCMCIYIMFNLMWWWWWWWGADLKMASNNVRFVNLFWPTVITSLAWILFI